MQEIKKIAIVGGGGIACALVPILIGMHEVVIIDGDSYEAKNGPRQFPALKSTANKAIALYEALEDRARFPISFIPKFVKGMMIVNEPEWENIDLIIGAVDNNASRRILAEIAADLEIPCILAGNEHQHGEAHLYLDKVHNPFDHFEFPETEPTPWSCNSKETLDEFPQTALANALAASSVLQLLLSWGHIQKPDNLLAYTRLDVSGSITKRVKDFAPEPA